MTFFRGKTIRTRRNNKPVKVYLIDEALRIIQKWGIKTERPNSYVFFDIPDGLDEETRYKIKGNCIRNINDRLEAVQAELGITGKINTNVARHSYATILKDNAVSIAQISENLGHSSIMTTVHYLDSFSDGKVKDTAELLESLFRSKKESL